MKVFGQEIKELLYDELPSKLQKIHPIIKKLYYVGNKNLLFEKTIAIVGTRNMTAYGRRMAMYFSKEICRRGTVIVSGLAKGVDGIAQETCIKNGGMTIGVMGTGFGELFPRENVGLMKEIIDSGGLIITEYDYYTKYDKRNFPKRNRIISGLADATLVVEATIKSGSCITARLSFEQEKKVFALPGRVIDSHSSGTNNLIKKGAYLVEKIDDMESIMTDYFDKFNNVEELIMPKEYEKIYEYLKESEYNIDELVSYKGLDYFEAAEALSNMEIDGYIENVGGTYRIVI